MSNRVRFCMSCGHRLHRVDKAAIARFAVLDPRCIRCRIDEALVERAEVLALGGAR